MIRHTCSDFSIREAKSSIDNDMFDYQRIQDSNLSQIPWWGEECSPTDTKDVHALMSGTCEHVLFHDRGELR